MRHADSCGSGAGENLRSKTNRIGMPFSMHISFVHSFPRVIYPNSIIMLCDCLPARAATGSRDMTQDSPLRQVRMQSGAVSVGSFGGLQGRHREFWLGVLCAEQTVGGVESSGPLQNRNCRQLWAMGIGEAPEGNSHLPTFGQMPNAKCSPCF